MLVLESAEHAQKRHANVYAQIDGWYSGRFGQQAPAHALHDAWIQLLSQNDTKPADLGLISAANGGSNRPHELAEIGALTELCTELNDDAQIVAVRSMVGEGEAWSTALQVAMAAYLLKQKHSLPTWNLGADSDAAISQRCRGGAITDNCNALVSGMDAGGAYSALMLSPYRE